MNSRAEQFEDAEKNFIRKDKVCRSESRISNHGDLVTREKPVTCREARSGLASGYEQDGRLQHREEVEINRL